MTDRILNNASTAMLARFGYSEASTMIQIISTLVNGSVYASHSLAHRDDYHHDAILDSDPMAWEWSLVHATRTQAPASWASSQAASFTCDCLPVVDCDVDLEDECPATLRSSEVAA